ncbi:MAG TPA: hypothetical protein VIL89_10015, partial [Clostridia bacterium]
LALPAYNSLMSDTNYVTTPPSVDAFIKSANYVGTDVQYKALMSGGFSKLNDIVYAELSSAFNGDQTIEDACANIDRIANSDVFK